MILTFNYKLANQSVVFFTMFNRKKSIQLQVYVFSANLLSISVNFINERLSACRYYNKLCLL